VFAWHAIASFHAVQTTRVTSGLNFLNPSTICRDFIVATSAVFGIIASHLRRIKKKIRNRITKLTI
jgi:hypothetical protein